jgi:hypothetical protein
MFNFNFNLNFSRCFRNNNSDNFKEKISEIKETIFKLPQQTRIKYLLQKIKNGSYDVIFLNYINGAEQRNQETIGSFDMLKINDFKCSMIPIFIGDNLKYHLVICIRTNSKKKLRMIDAELFSLLKELLTNL